MMERSEWLELARQLDWEFSHVDPREVYPEALSGSPWLPAEAWRGWEEPYKTSYREYVRNQQAKEAALSAVRDAIGGIDHFQDISRSWLSALKLFGATFALAEFAATLGNLRMARFGRHSAWRSMSVLGALDEYRHTEIPLLSMHGLIPWDVQFDWTHRFYHTNNWIAIAARHLVDELLIGPSAIEFAVATNFVFETGFTNLQFLGLATMADQLGDDAFEEMVKSIQTDEARHSQMGPAVVAVAVAADPKQVQELVDKWFWRSWRLFAIVTGFSMDYLTPLHARQLSFKEFMHEWILDQFIHSLDQFGLKKPWYWDTFVEELELYHHMLFASAYTYRATTWFDFPLPGPQELAWLEAKYPRFAELRPVWRRIHERWGQADPGMDFSVHGTSIIGFCDTCQIVLCGGSPARNSCRIRAHKGRKYVFCSQPCEWIFFREPERYQDHLNLVMRVVAGQAPGNLIGMLEDYFGLSYREWGKDIAAGRYPWIRRPEKATREGGPG